MTMVILTPICDDVTMICQSYTDNITVVFDNIISNAGGLVGLYAEYRPLTRYAKLRVTRALGLLGTFSPPPTSKETAS